MSAPQPPVPVTLLDVVKRTTEYFQRNGVERPRLDAEWIIAHALGLKRMQLYLQFERTLVEAELARIRPLVRRRAAREPLQHVLGDTEFHHLRLRVDARVLVPRPETEHLVALLLERCVPPPPESVLDLGTGSGAIALALARALPKAVVTATDVAEEALEVARANARSNDLENRVRFLRSSWFEGLPGDARFAWIVSNPPYLSAAEYATLAPEIRGHEPRGALVAEDDGAADLVAILRAARGRLLPGGLLALETGIDHHPRLLALAADLGYASAEGLPDLTGRPRFLLARTSPPPA